MVVQGSILCTCFLKCIMKVSFDDCISSPYALTAGITSNNIVITALQWVIKPLRCYYSPVSPFGFITVRATSYLNTEMHVEPHIS